MPSVDSSIPYALRLHQTRSDALLNAPEKRYYSAQCHEDKSCVEKADEREHDEAG
jgi:hypothetical protein